MPGPGVPGRAVSAPGGAWSEGCLLRGGTGVYSGGGAWWRPPPTATAAGGTHPTGMHSCFKETFVHKSTIQESSIEIDFIQGSEKCRD